LRPFSAFGDAACIFAHAITASHSSSLPSGTGGGRKRAATRCSGTSAHDSEEWARVVAGLARRFRDLDLAEEAAGRDLRDGGRPVACRRRAANCGAWLATTANRWKPIKLGPLRE
jgi:hypothetical protein